MRKTAVFPKRKCAACNVEYQPRGAYQKFCPECSKSADVARKRDWYKRNNPDAYAERELHFCVTCGKPAESRFQGGEWYCNLHWQRMSRYGTTDNPPRESKNTFTVDSGLLYIRTTQGETIVVDSDDAPALRQYSWCVSKTGYAVARINGKVIKLHRYLLNPSPKLVVDHINGNKLDNRRENLRVCQQSRNSKNVSIKPSNTSGFPGIRKLPDGKFNVRITVDRKGMHVGNFETIEQAIAARIKAESEHYGEYAPSVGATKSLVAHTSSRGNSPAKQ